MTRSERVLALSIALTVCIWIAALLVFVQRAKQDRHQFAYCFATGHNLAYPCHENPYWSADL